jgi:hypothetical protein
MKKSKRFEKANHSLDPVYLISFLLMVVGLALMLTSLELEQLQENHLKSPVVNTHEAAIQGAGQSEPPNVTAQTILPNPIASWSGPFARLISKLVGELGMGLFSIGGIALLLEVPLMTRFFETKMARSITGREYLRRLKKEQLIELQGDSLRAYWDVDEADIGNLLDYCKDEVQTFVGKPFREDVNGRFMINPINGKPYYEVEERLSFTCRANRGQIQREIRWSTHSAEIGNILKFEVKLTLPKQAWESTYKEIYPQRELWFRSENQDNVDVGDANTLQRLNNWVRTTLTELGFDTMQNTKSETLPGSPAGETDRPAIAPGVSQQAADAKSEQTGNSGKAIKTKATRLKTSTKLEPLEGKHVGFTLSLEEFKDVDFLHVTVLTKYEAPIGRSVTWQMTDPSKKVKGDIYFPGLTFYLETFGISGQYLQEDDKPPNESPQTFEYNSWVLPECGFVFHFLPQTNSAESSASRDTIVV